MLVIGNKRKVLLTIGVFFICFILLNLHFGKKIEEAPGWCDYVLYWQLGKNLFKEGHFSLYTLENPFRGTILPLIYGGMYYIGANVFASETIGYIVCSSLIYAILYAVIIPLFIKQMGLKSDIFIMGGILCLSLIFWYGIFLYPLSDVMAFLFVLIACCLLQKSQKNVGHKNLVYGIGIGVCLYCAYNIRSVYMFAAFCILISAAIQNIKNRKVFGVMLGNVCGIMIAAIPQIIINKALFGVWSIKNIASQSIIKLHLKTGFEVQRYETYVGEIGKEIGKQYPNYSVVFEDPIGIELLAREGIEAFDSIGEYFLFCLRNFFDVVGVFIRHLINALCPCYPELYIENVNRNRVLLILLNVIILYLGGYILVYALKYKSSFFIRVLKENFLNFMIILIPCMASIPGAIELRFFFPLHVLVYILVAVGIRSGEVRKSIISKWYLHCLCFALVLMPFWVIWGETFAKMRYVVALYSPWG